ncbi:MAG: ABC transporter ATP-binding protein [Actinobacteria bacterium]|jgi:branched-chain amino acid transport system ATP-binding protein|nr:ABC transporter ATP-binding protein [Actinomycetota bacterium]
MANLSVSSVTVRFSGNVAVNDVDLTAESGHITGLIGPNGAGKTTLFNVITGLLQPTAGRVTLDGRDITKLTPYKRARRGLARTFQRLELFSMLTARENIRVAADIHKGWARTTKSPDRVADEILERVGLTEVADVRVDSLPTGQGRLVELGRALATNPRVLLLDEPAAGQDDAETDRFAELLREFAADGMGVLLVEHDVSLVMDVCETIHVLDFGEIIAVGPPEEIRVNDAVLAAYLGAPVEPTA